jgi:hypothetical protein
MSTSIVYRRALRRLATSIVLTMLNIIACAVTVDSVSHDSLSPLILLLTVPLVLTLGNIWRCTLKDLAYIGAAVSAVDAEVQERVSAQV